VSETLGAAGSAVAGSEAGWPHDSVQVGTRASGLTACLPVRLTLLREGSACPFSLAWSNTQWYDFALVLVIDMPQDR
jgi:hypothetical protein